jgi:hypothetical protein
VARRKHPKKEVEQALSYAEDEGWKVEPKPKSGHAWGHACCPEHPGGCRVGIWSTPRNAGNHAKDIRRAVRRCPHEETDEETDE